jgi:hypothetical protein
LVVEELKIKMMFKAGQEVVAIRNHPDGVFKKGSIFMVRETEKSMCGCMAFIVDIGIQSKGGDLRCVLCNGLFKNHTSIWWFANHHFVPLQSEQAERILEEAEPCEMELVTIIR